MNTNHSHANLTISAKSVNFDKLTMFYKVNDQMEIIYDKIVGQVVAGKYRIDSFLDNG